jgi:ABC-2 type transport system permease protein
MRTLRDIGLLYRRHQVQMLRNPVWLVVGFSTPILYLALFTPLLEHFLHVSSTGAVLNLFLPGILALLAFASGTSMGFGTIFELQSGVVERFRVTPVSRLAILAGPILSGLTMMFIFDAVVVAIGAGLGFHIDWLGILVMVVLLSLLTISMGSFSIATALKTKEISAFAAVINGLQLPSLLLAGVLLQINSQTAPTWMQVLAHFNPLFYLVESCRDLAVGGFGRPEVWQAFAVLTPLCALTVTWATRVFRKAVS